MSHIHIDRRTYYISQNFDIVSQCLSHSHHTECMQVHRERQILWLSFYLYLYRLDVVVVVVVVNVAVNKGL